MEGRRLDGVVAMLEVRRRSEIPNAICSARALESKWEKRDHLEIHSQRPNGAAHREKVDTPPLKGLRMEPFRSHLETCRATST